MEFGGPVWHASAAPVPGRKAHKGGLQAAALVALAAVGEKSLGEWHEWSGYTYHVRRRLSADEQMVIGDVVDCRGTYEWQKRWESVKRELPAGALPRVMLLALSEKDPACTVKT
jgi:hypothetical protein